VDFRFSAGDGNIELSAEYGRGMTIQERLQEREHPQTAMEMTVFAPAKLKLVVWAVNGKVSLKGWSAPLEVRTSSGPIRIETIKSDSVSLLCPSCAIEARSVRSSLRCMGGSGPIELSDVSGQTVYVESVSGALKLSHVEGEQLYV